MKEGEPKPILKCMICIPDVHCDAIGVLGKIKARIGNFPTLNDKWIIWEKIEDCSTRKSIAEEFKKLVTNPLDKLDGI